MSPELLKCWTLLVLNLTALSNTNIKFCLCNYLFLSFSCSFSSSLSSFSSTRHFPQIFPYSYLSFSIFSMLTFAQFYTGCLQMNGAVSKVNNKCISHLTRAQRTPSAAATLQVSHALQQFASHAYCGASFQDGVAAGKGFLCAPFWGVQICDYSAAWV